MFNEADTRARLVDPQLKSSNWDDQTTLREYTITAGKVNIFGDQVVRDEREFEESGI